MGLFDNWLGSGGGYAPTNSVNDYSSDFNPRLGVLQDLLANRYGLDVGLGSGTRGFALQNSLYAQGRTRPGAIVTGAPAGSSYHNYGAAADLVPRNMNEAQAGPIIGQALRENPDLNLGWGGNFSNLYDPLHVQLGMPLSALQQGARVPATGSPAGLPDYSMAEAPVGPDPQSQQLAVGSPTEAGGGMLAGSAPVAGQAAGGTPRTLGGYPGGSGGILTGGNSLSGALMSPLTQFGLALASGRTPQEGIGAAGKAALTAGEYEKQQQGQAALYQSLITQGMDPRQATAIASNPATAHLFMPQLKTTKDALGQESVQAISPWTGQPIARPGQQGQSGGTGGTGPGVNFSILAPGVKQYDPNLPADEFKSQFGPEVSAAMDAYIRGDVMPSGNPRQNSINTFAKTMAQTYGQKAGIDVSDTAYAAKRKFVTDAQSSTPNSFGGQRNAGNTALEHQHTIAEKINDLNNVDWPILPQGAAAINWLRQKGSTAQSTAANNLNDAVDLYVNEVKKFYSGSGTGGVEEREAARARFNSAKTPTELYGALRTEQELMSGKLNQLDQQAQTTMGPNYASDKRLGPVLRPKTEKAIEQTNELISNHDRGVKAKSAGEPSKASEAPKAEMPKVGEVRKGYRFKGGDPSQQSSWEKQ